MPDDAPRAATLTMNPAVDRSFAVDRAEPERKLRGQNVQDTAGGGGLNVARALTELGHPTRAYWTCGGAFGTQIHELLDADAIDHVPLPIQGLTRQNTMIQETSTGRQFRFQVPGPRLVPADEERALARLAEIPAGVEYIVASGSLPPGVGDDFYVRVAAAAPEGTRVVLDSHGPALVEGVKAGVFLVKPNVAELEQLTGQDVSDEASIDDAARGIVEKGWAQHVAVSLGSHGAMLVSREDAVHVATPSVEARSVVGAGDSMVGGIVAGLLRGWDLVGATRLGVAAGAAAVSCDGTGLCRRQDAEFLLARTHASPPEAGRTPVQ